MTPTSLASRSLSSFDGDVLAYAVLGIGAVIVGIVLMVLAKRFRSSGEAEARPAPRTPEPPAANTLAARSPAVQRLRQDVRRWSERSD